MTTEDLRNLEKSVSLTTILLFVILFADCYYD